MEKLINRQRLLDLITVYIQDARAEKRLCQRHSPGWNRADALQISLTDLLRTVKQWSFTTLD